MGFFCRKAGPDIAGKTEFVTGKKFKCEQPCLSKTENQSEFKLKKNIGEGMKIFWKYQLAV
jgi:hypothetical protein